MSTAIKNLEYVRDNGSYHNAGDKVWAQPKEATIEPVLKNIPAFKSKYYTPYEEYEKLNPPPRPDLNDIIGQKMQQYEDMLFNMLMMMC